MKDGEEIPWWISFFGICVTIIFLFFVIINIYADVKDNFSCHYEYNYYYDDAI